MQDNQVDVADLFDDADDGMLIDAAYESDGGGSIPGIDTDVDEDNDNDDIDDASTADSVKPASVSLPLGMRYGLLVRISLCICGEAGCQELILLLLNLYSMQMQSNSSQR